MMSRLRKWLAPCYSGLAFSRFANKKYNGAASLFEKVCEADPEAERIELIYSCLGRSYLALGRDQEALKTLSIAYKLYLERNRALEDDFEIQQFRQLLKALNHLLIKAGEPDRAQEILHRGERLLSEPRKLDS